MTDYSTMRLKGKVAVITGAGRGIGRGIAFRLAKEGASVIVTDKDLALASETVSEIVSRGGEATAAALDVVVEQQFDSLLEFVKKRIGKPIDIWINNAGIQQLKEVWDISSEDWENMMNVNARGVFFGMKAAALEMKSRGGVIVNTASIMGRQGHPLYAHYAASKAAIISLTKSFALALAPYGIRVNSVAPGMVDTDMWDLCDAQWAELKGLKRGEPKAMRIREIPFGRAGTPEDIAGAVAFLCSDDASYITGECIHISGGAYML